MGKDTAYPVLEFPERGVAPPKDRPPSIVGKGNFTLRFLRHDAVKPLGICHCDLPFLPHVLRTAVGGDLETGSFLQSLFQLAQIFYHTYLLFVSMFNIINSISMSVSARTRQYEAMRAVGMEGRQLSRMISAEAYTYAFFGCIFGCGIGLPASKVIYTRLVTAHFGELFYWTVPVH